MRHKDSHHPRTNHADEWCERIKRELYPDYDLIVLDSNDPDTLAANPWIPRILDRQFESELERERERFKAQTECERADEHVRHELDTHISASFFLDATDPETEAMFAGQNWWEQVRAARAAEPIEAYMLRNEIA